ERHGRTLLKLNEKQQKTYLDKIVNEELNVKELEELVEKTTKKAKPKKKTKKAQIISKDIRIDTNTIKESLKMIENTGINVEKKRKKIKKKKTKKKKKQKEEKIINKEIRIDNNTMKQ